MACGNSPRAVRRFTVISLFVMVLALGTPTVALADGLLGGVTQAAAPLTQAPVSSPVTSVMQPVTVAVAPVTQPVTSTVAPVAQTVAKAAAPAATTVSTVVAPVATAAAQVVAPVATAAAQVVAPVATAAAQVVAPVATAAAQVVTPVATAAAQVVAPVTTAAVHAAQDATTGGTHVVALAAPTTPTAKTPPAVAQVANAAQLPTSSEQVASPSSTPENSVVPAGAAPATSAGPADAARPAASAAAPDVQRSLHRDAAAVRILRSPANSVAVAPSQLQAAHAHPASFGTSPVQRATGGAARVVHTTGFPPFAPAAPSGLSALLGGSLSTFVGSGLTVALVFLLALIPPRPGRRLRPLDGLVLVPALLAPVERPG